MNGWLPKDTIGMDLILCEDLSGAATDFAIHIGVSGVSYDF